MMQNIRLRDTVLILVFEMICANIREKGYLN